jgi:hypothetical protein
LVGLDYHLHNKTHAAADEIAVMLWVLSAKVYGRSGGRSMTCRLFSATTTPL